MSSAAPATRRTRWIDPAGWPLRTRIVTTMIALLAVLGLVVGGTAELYLFQSLHKQVENDVREMSNRLEKSPDGKGFNPFGNKPSGNTPKDGPTDGSNGSKLPGGLREDSLVVTIGTDGNADGGYIENAPASLDTTAVELSDTALATLRSEVPTTGEEIDVDLGDGRSKYLIKAVLRADGP
ncbi:MAG TPA: two-component sensor histidine kinase, partial [Actinoplanes sp.]|nr:two-component sensor histidine kinase [Actinoplanes sp.]